MLTDNLARHGICWFFSNSLTFLANFDSKAPPTISISSIIFTCAIGQEKRSWVAVDVISSAPQDIQDYLLVITACCNEHLLPHALRFLRITFPVQITVAKFCRLFRSSRVGPFNELTWLDEVGTQLGYLGPDDGINVLRQLVCFSHCLSGIFYVWITNCEWPYSIVIVYVAKASTRPRMDGALKPEREVSIDVLRLMCLITYVMPDTICSLCCEGEVVALMRAYGNDNSLWLWTDDWLPHCLTVLTSKTWVGGNDGRGEQIFRPTN